MHLMHLIYKFNYNNVIIFIYTLSNSIIYTEKNTIALNNVMRLLKYYEYTNNKWWFRVWECFIKIINVLLITEVICQSRWAVSYQYIWL